MCSARCVLRNTRTLTVLVVLGLMFTYVGVGSAGASEAAFGIEDFANSVFDAAEKPILQAGAHPYALETRIFFNHEVEEELPELGEPGGRIPSLVKTYGDPKDVTVNLPAGLIANPTAPLARCTEAELETEPASCRPASKIGMVIGYVNEFPFRVEDPLYNMVPPTGKPAEFGANLAGLGIVVHISGKVRTGGDYGITGEVKNLLHSHTIYGADVMLFGNVPESSEALLTMPTACTGRSLLSTTEVASWPEPTELHASAVVTTFGPVTGCGAIGFGPRIEARPGSSATSTATGLRFKLEIPQEGGGSGLATSEVKKAEVKLPEGMTVNPSAANGLGACTPLQIGLESTPNQQQTITIERPQDNSFTLSFDGHSTAALPADASAQAVEVALDGLPGLASGELHVIAIAGGWMVEFQGSRASQEVSAISGTVAVNSVQMVTVPNFTNGSFDLSMEGQSTAAEATGDVSSGSATITGITVNAGTMLPGEAISGVGIPPGTTIVELGSGTLVLSTPATESAAGTALSIDLPGNASDGVVQAALEALPAIGGSNVLVDGGFENGITGSRRPYKITFVGSLATPTQAPTMEVTEPGIAKPAAHVTAQSAGVLPLAVATTQRAGGAPHFSEGAPSCPNTSKIGQVSITTPLLDHPLPGSVYLASQEDNPFHSLVAIYIVVDDPATGVIVKLAGEVKLDPSTGRLTAIVDENPQLPFEDLTLEVFGGPTGPLVTPARCGSYRVESLLEPWSHQPAAGEQTGTPNAAPLAEAFSIDENCGFAGFAPSFIGGTLNNQAGAYSPVTVALSRADSEQTFKDLAVTAPPGLSGKLAGIPLCGDDDANAGACPSGSRIGSVMVTAGVGPDPVSVSGTIYLSGPYNGGPFGIIVEVPAIAGPFDLDEGGKPVVVRGSIRVDPNTAQPTVVSDAFPNMLRGIPLHVRSVNVTLDRPGFTFNPTNCQPMALNGSSTSTEGTTAGISSPFGAANCASLPFKPKFTFSTRGKASKANGTSLDVKVITKGSGEANTRSVVVSLPKQLPSRLTTLQRACLAATFATNPAACPHGSDVGTASVVTPILAQPLTGPAYLVSHGGAAFPDLEIVLQGEGVTLVLDGNTSIKKGITTSTFRTVPDAPFSSFELKLPSGPFSVLGTFLPPKANYNLCGQKLLIPITITGQNGAVIRQSIKTSISGCPKAKKPKKKVKHKKKNKATRK